MVAMIRAGETGGFLDGALERIATNFEKDAALRGKIKSALTYPAIVLLFSGVLISGVLIFIVPIFEKMFDQLGGKLPLPTQLMVTASHTLAWSGPLFVAVVVGGTVAFKAQLRRSTGLRLQVDRLKLRLPVFGPLCHEDRDQPVLPQPGHAARRRRAGACRRWTWSAPPPATRSSPRPWGTCRTSVREGQPMSSRAAATTASSHRWSPR